MHKDLGLLLFLLDRIECVDEHDDSFHAHIRIAASDLHTGQAAPPTRWPGSCELILAERRSECGLLRQVVESGRGGGIRTRDLVLPKHVR